MILVLMLLYAYNARTYAEAFCAKDPINKLILKTDRRRLILAICIDLLILPTLFYSIISFNFGE